MSGLYSTAILGNSEIYMTYICDKFHFLFNVEEIQELGGLGLYMVAHSPLGPPILPALANLSPLFPFIIFPLTKFCLISNHHNPVTDQEQERGRAITTTPISTTQEDFHL